MGLEAVTFIDDFNVDWPLSTDKRRQGDDHLRAIKLGVKNTFPNITGVVTKTQAELNAIPLNLDLILPLLIANLEAKGTIKGWDLVNMGSIPTGWVECDGSTVPGYGVVPDMRDRFVLGRGPANTVASVGGAANVNSSDSGGHTPVVQAHALTSGELPSHGHRLYTWETGASSDANNFATVFSKGIAGNTTGTFAYRSANNDGVKLVEDAATAATGHVHSAAAVVDHFHTVATVPPFYTMVWIVKVTEYEAP